MRFPSLIGDTFAFEKRICLLFQTSPHSAQRIEKENISRVEQSFKMASTISLNDIHRPLRLRFG